MHRISKNVRVRIWGIGIAATAMIAASVMVGSCVFDTKTNLCEKFDLRCKEGQQCATDQPVCIDIGGCGNHRLDPGEVCDDGNTMDGDGCSADCKSDETCGNSKVDVNAKVPETCDDGSRNGVGDDPCDAHCQLRSEVCGNGIVDKNEECDPGPMGDSKTCNSFLANSLGLGCKIAMCGDGYFNSEAEKCDTGGIDTDTCNGPLCTLPSCGDNYHNTAANEECDNGSADTKGCNGNNQGLNGPGSCKFPSCGDSYVNTKFTPSGSTQSETCDTGGDSQTCNGDGNGNGVAGNNVNAQCQPPRCGDSYVNTKFTPSGSTQVEQCDTGGDSQTCNGDGNGNASNNANAQCQAPKCGDSYINSMFKPSGSTKTETCDTGGDSQTCNGDGNGDASNNANAQCQASKCGDGYVNSMFKPSGSTQVENCDNQGGNDTQGCNGNNNNNNGPGSCRIPSCGDGYVNSMFKPSGSTQVEQCDNLGGIDTSGCNGNNNNNGPGSCRIPSCGDGYVNPMFNPPGGSKAEECDNGDPSHGIPAVPCPPGAGTCTQCHCI